MSPIRINGELLKALIQRQFRGGVNELLSIWDTQGGVHRSTVHRWAKGSLPQSREDMLRLCGILDVDPFCLVLPACGDAMGAVNQLIYAFQNDHWRPALSFIKDFMGRRPEWPPKYVAAEYFGRQWYTKDFEHDSSVMKNFYSPIVIFGELQKDLMRPQTFHFAYRHENLFGRRWLHYGFVVRSGLAVRLLHINGHTDEYITRNHREPTRVETFFGQENAIFRIASLHPFSLNIGPERDNVDSAVRFVAG